MKFKHASVRYKYNIVYGRPLTGSRMMKRQPLLEQVGRVVGEKWSYSHISKHLSLSHAALWMDEYLAGGLNRVGRQVPSIPGAPDTAWLVQALWLSCRVAPGLPGSPTSLAPCRQRLLAAKEGQKF